MADTEAVSNSFSLNKLARIKQEARLESVILPLDAIDYPYFVQRFEADYFNAGSSLPDGLHGGS
jgi:hypothetical protein